MAQEQKYDVFISYARRDYVDNNRKVIPNNVVSQIKDLLSKEGISYWFDEDGIYSGQDFTDKIPSSIEASKIFLYLSTANANASKWTSKEIATADELGKYIIPVRIDDTPYNKKVLFRIADLNFIEYYANPEQGISDLLKSIKAYLQENSHISTPLIPENQNKRIISKEETSNTPKEHDTEGLEYEYNYENLTASIIGVGTTKDMDIIIPTKIFHANKEFRVTGIGYQAFKNNNKLYSIFISKYVSNIHSYAFVNCSELRSIKVAEENPHYCSEAGVLFNREKSTLIQYPTGKSQENYTIPSCVKSIDDIAFLGCKHLKSIKTPNTMKSIRRLAFSGCESLCSIAIPNDITCIEESVFDGCCNLQVIKIPSSVKTIKEHAFRGCSRLTSVAIPSSTSKIENNAFIGCDNLRSVIIPSMTVVAADAFPKTCQVNKQTPKIVIIPKEADSSRLNNQNNAEVVFWNHHCNTYSGCKRYLERYPTVNMH